MPSLTTTLGGTIAAVCSRCRSRRNLRIRHGQGLARTRRCDEPSNDLGLLLCYNETRTHLGLRRNVRQVCDGGPRCWITSWPTGRQSLHTKRRLPGTSGAFGRRLQRSALFGDLEVGDCSEYKTPGSVTWDGVSRPSVHSQITVWNTLDLTVRRHDADRCCRCLGHVFMQRSGCSAGTNGLPNSAVPVRTSSTTCEGRRAMSLHDAEWRYGKRIFHKAAGPSAPNSSCSCGQSP